MYEEYFNLNERPYMAAARVDRYFPAAVIEQARQRLTRCIERAEGIAVLVAPSGTGKSLLCQVLAEQCKEMFKVVLLASGRLCSPRALLQAILYELDLSYRDMDEGELRLTLIDHLRSTQACPNGIVLLVDEAHSLSVRLLEEIRVLTNSASFGQTRVRLLLAGNARLEERLGEPKLEALSQRIVARCYLDPLNREETVHYVRAQFAAVGGQPDRVFDEDSLVAIHQAAEGIPRVINQLCDHALVMACDQGAERLNAAAIEQAWADLQQLPTPSITSSPPDKQEGSVVEFGGLDEDLDEQDLPESVPFVSSEGTTDCSSSSETLNFAAAPQREPFEEPPVEPDADFQNTEQNEQPYQSLGTIGPADLELADLDLPDLKLQVSPDLFTEDFDTEEIVVDRYIAVENRWSARPLEASRGGLEIPQVQLAQEAHPPVHEHCVTVKPTELESSFEPVMSVRRDQLRVRFDGGPQDINEAFDDDTIIVKDDGPAGQLGIKSWVKGAHPRQDHQMSSKLWHGFPQKPG